MNLRGESLSGGGSIIRYRVVASGRVPESEVLIELWMSRAGWLVESLAASGVQVPDLEVIRVDGLTDGAASGPDETSRSAKEASSFLRRRPGGSLSLAGSTPRAVPNGPVVVEVDCEVSAQEPEWLTFDLTLAVLDEPEAIMGSLLPDALVEFLTDVCSYDEIQYAEAGFGSPLRGTTNWELHLEPDAGFGVGARLADVWLRGLGPVTYFNQQILERLFEATDQLFGVAPQGFLSKHFGPLVTRKCGSGLLVVLENGWQDQRRLEEEVPDVLRTLMVSEPLLAAADHFATSGTSIMQLSEDLLTLANEKPWHGPGAWLPEEVDERLWELDDEREASSRS